jgi:two-component system OmpR family response regulator
VNTAAAKRILIVDDNEMAAELLGEFLELTGHSIRIAHSGGDALEAARDYAPEVVIVDIVLPDTDGYALAGGLRKAIASGCKIIALSGLPQNMRRGDHTIFDAWLEKPADLDVLEELVAKD